MTASAAAVRGSSRPSSSGEETFNKGDEEKDLTHNYFLVDRADFNAAAAFEDFDPAMFTKGLYSSGAVGHFSKAIRRFLVALGNVFALRPEARAVLQLQGMEFLQGLATLGYISGEPEMASRCEGAAHFARSTSSAPWCSTM